jgi:hypothetical protein
MDEQDGKHLAEILSVLGQAGEWAARIARPVVPDPAPRSSLCGDDRKAHPFEVSHASWHFLSHAVDHLACLRALIGKAGFVPMYAPFTIVRGALENACAAVWLLQPEKRDERLERRLRLASDDIRNGEQVKELTGRTGPRSEHERADQVRDIARRAGLDEKKAIARVSYHEIVKFVEENGPANGAVVAAWKLCSGYAHGDMWTTFAASRRIEVASTANPAIGAFKIEANLGLLSNVTHLAVSLTSLGWQLYDQRCQAPS